MLGGYFILPHPVDWSTSSSDLGIILDNNVKSDQHISHNVHSINVTATLILEAPSQ